MHVPLIDGGKIVFIQSWVLKSPTWLKLNRLLKKLQWEHQYCPSMKPGMSEGEKQWIEALLKCCRKETTEYECDQKDWADHNEAMQEEKERQQKTEKSSQWVETKMGESSKGETSTSTLKVKMSKGRKIEVVRMKTGGQTGETSQRQAEKAEGESKDKKDESSTENKEEHYEAESYDPPVEFEDPMFELIQKELEEEYDEMSPEQKREMISQLMPRERAEYQEMTGFYQVQASMTSQGMELRSEMIKERAK